MPLTYIFQFPRSYQVRGHLAAKIDPLGLNNMGEEEAKKMIIRSVTVDEKVGFAREDKIRKPHHVQPVCLIFNEMM